MTLQTSNGPKPGTALETRSRAIKILQDYYVTKPSIKGLLNMLTGYDDDDSKGLVADVIARNPDRKIQAAAYKGQIAGREAVVRFAEHRQGPQAARDRSRKTQGKD